MFLLLLFINHCLDITYTKFSLKKMQFPEPSYAVHSCAVSIFSFSAKLLQKEVILF